MKSTYRIRNGKERTSTRKKTMNSMFVRRRKIVIEYLEKQLSMGIKFTKDGISNVLLVSKDIERITKELNILKQRI